MYAFIARGARNVREPHSGDLEEQELLSMSFSAAIAKLRGCEITQLSTAAALGLAAIALREDR